VWLPGSAPGPGPLRRRAELTEARASLERADAARAGLAREADAVLPLEAGDERAVAATKTYINSLGAIALLFAATDGPVAEAELEQMPEVLRQQIELSLETAPPLDEYRGAVGATVVARGVNYGTAFEIELKIRELSGLLFEAYSGADLMHGPVAAVGAGWPVFALAPSGPARASMEEAIDGVARRGARLIIASDDEALLARADVSFPLLPGVPEWLSPLTSVVPGQLAALRLARLRGIDLDRPLGLSKVTLTR